MLAVRHLLARPLQAALVLGTGVQAFHHALALNAEARRVDRALRLVVAGRDDGRVAELVSRLRAHGVAASAGTVEDVAHADVTVSATSAGVPLFDGRRVPDGAVVVAIGSHTATTRDVDEALLARSVVVVESRRSARQEAGAVLMAAAGGAIGAVDTVPNLADLVAGRVDRDPGRPRVFVGTGMSWQDLAVARAAVRWARGGPHPWS